MHEDVSLKEPELAVPSLAPITKATRILLVDAERTFSELLQATLRNDHQQVHALDGHETEEVIAHCLALRPDLLILDPVSTSHSAAELVRQLRRLHPAGRILLLPNGSHSAYVEIAEAIQAGADGCVFKTEPLAELRLAIQQIGHGRRHFSPRAEAELKSGGTSAVRRLSSRQREVLRLIAQGFSTKEISQALNLSVKTAGHHRLRLMKKLELHDPVSVARFALANGLVRL